MKVPNICPAVLEDMEEILALQKAAYITEAEIYHNFNIPPLLQTLEETIDEARNGLILKAIADGRIVGSVRGTKKGGTCFIGKLMVLPGYRREGTGTRLMAAIENAFPGCRFELFTGHLSIKNLSLYESQGYRRFKTVQTGPDLKFIYLEKPATQPSK